MAPSYCLRTNPLSYRPCRLDREHTGVHVSTDGLEFSSERGAHWVASPSPARCNSTYQRVGEPLLQCERAAGHVMSEHLNGTVTWESMQPLYPPVPPFFRRGLCGVVMSEGGTCELLGQHEGAHMRKIRSIEKCPATFTFNSDLRQCQLLEGHPDGHSYGVAPSPVFKVPAGYAPPPAYEFKADPETPVSNLSLQCQSWWCPLQGGKYQCELVEGHTGDHINTNPTDMARGLRRCWPQLGSVQRVKGPSMAAPMTDEERQEYIRRHQKLIDNYHELERTADNLYRFVCGLSENLMTKPQIEERMRLKRELGVLLGRVKK